MALAWRQSTHDTLVRSHPHGDIPPVHDLQYGARRGGPRETEGGVARPRLLTAVTVCRHLPKSVVTVCRCGPCSRSPYSPLPAVQGMRLPAVAGGQQAGSSLGTEHAPCRSSISAPQQMAAPAVPSQYMTMPGSTGFSHAIETGQVVPVPCQGEAD